MIQFPPPKDNPTIYLCPQCDDGETTVRAEIRVGGVLYVCPRCSWGYQCRVGVNAACYFKVRGAE